MKRNLSRQQQVGQDISVSTEQKEEHRLLWEKMRDHIRQHCLLSGKDFMLSAGDKSSFYFDCKKATLNGRFLSWMADYILQAVVPKLPHSIDTVGGMTIGADFMTAALVMRAAEYDMSIGEGSIVRKEPKKHGTRSHIENELPDRSILVVEDVVTTGASIIKACEQFQKSGYEVVALLTLVDREAGGLENIKRHCELPVIAVFSASDFAIRQA